MNQEVQALAQTLWDYQCLHMPLTPADVIIVLGSRDLRPAKRGAELFLQGYAPLLVMSGGLGRITKDEWAESEAVKYARIAEDMGVPKDKILIEDQSTNTGENITFSRDLLAKHGVDPHSIILVHKPYMERRSYATCRMLWPEKDPQVTSPQLSMLEWMTTDPNGEELVDILVGDTQRIKLYAEKGFQIPQPMPENVWQAVEQLIAMGYTKHLAK